VSSLHLTRSLAAPAAAVWRAFTDPVALATWFWPAASFGTTAEVDLRPGGRFRIAAPRRGFAVSGSYVEVEPPGRLVFTWRWDGEADETLVTVTLTATGVGCELDLRHDRFPDVASRDGNAQGWSDCLDRLPGWLLTGSEAPAG
jgi:uncharacterized protein YndB with AHSA1/START domain